jgi:glycosyltransferase involved in cell wall biosynthesis
LYEQGLETCFIDNESTDNSLEIAERFRKKGVFRIETQPYPGYFDLVAQLELKEKLANEIDANWFIHYDADEIREAPLPYKTLREGIVDADKKGYNAINFDEFVFLPTSFSESFEGKDYYKEMKYYYFFEPAPIRHVKAFKKTNTVLDIASTGGHRINFEGLNVYPISFILRHYVVLSKNHAIEKYCKERIYSQSEIEERGWHGPRATFTPDKLIFPSKQQLKSIETGFWDRSDVWTKHTFLTGKTV